MKILARRFESRYKIKVILRVALMSNMETSQEHIRMMSL